MNVDMRLDVAFEQTLDFLMRYVLWNFMSVSCSICMHQICCTAICRGIDQPCGNRVGLTPRYQILLRLSLHKPLIVVDTKLSKNLSTRLCEFLNSSPKYWSYFMFRTISKQDEEYRYANLRCSQNCRCSRAGSTFCFMLPIGVRVKSELNLRSCNCLESFREDWFRWCNSFHFTIVDISQRLVART